MDKQQEHLAYQPQRPPTGGGGVGGKRKRRPTTFAGFLTSDRQLDNLITGKQQPGPSSDVPSEGAVTSSLTHEQQVQQQRAAFAAATAAHPSVSTPTVPAQPTTSQSQQQPVQAAAATDSQPKRRKSSVGTPSKGEQQGVTSPPQSARGVGSGGLPTTGAPSHPNVKKVVGVQNATRKALEWLQYGDLTLLDLTQSLPKLSKARVEIVMEALRAAGLVTLVRKHAPDALGNDHVTEVYRFSAGRSAAQALEIGGGEPVALGSISKRIKSSESELKALNERINVLKTAAAKPNPEPQQVLEILRHFMKQDKNLDEDPFYSVAFKATSAAAAKAAKAAAAVRAAVMAEADRAAKVASQAKQKAAEAAAAAAIAEAKRSAAAAVAAEAASTAAASAAAAAAAAIAASVSADAVTPTATVNHATTSQALATAAPAQAIVSVSASPAAPTVGTTSTPFVGQPGGVVSGEASAALPPRKS